MLSLAIEEWGIEKSLKKLNGMFAFAHYDQRRQILTLARDRIGIKPLYYGFSSIGFFFSSELKGMLNFPEFAATLSNEALSLFSAWLHNSPLFYI